jgi:hypothetical protein
MEAIASAELASLCAQPRFVEARRAASLQIIEDHKGNRLLNSVFGDRGRFMIGMLVQYLHHVRLDGETDAGLTVSRLRAMCVQTGFSSPGRATAMLGLMRFAGYLASQRSPHDLRQRVFVPTERLTALQRRRWSRHLAALSIIMPEGGAGLERIGQPGFEAALLRHMVGAVVAGFRFASHVPELSPYFERTGALLTLIQVVELAHACGGTAPASVSGLASQFGVARAQVRKILDDAATDGFILRTSGSREPIVVLPRLVAAVDRFFSVSFLHTARCVRPALAESHGHSPAVTFAGETT